MRENHWGTMEKTKWVVAVLAPFTSSGYNEIVAAFMTQKECTAWAQENHGPRWRSMAFVQRRSAARMVEQP